MKLDRHKIGNYDIWRNIFTKAVFNSQESPWNLIELGRVSFEGDSYNALFKHPCSRYIFCYKIFTHKFWQLFLPTCYYIKAAKTHRYKKIAQIMLMKFTTGVDFTQQFTSNFDIHGPQKHKKTLITGLSFFTFVTCTHKSY